MNWHEQRSWLRISALVLFAASAIAAQAAGAPAKPTTATSTQPDVKLSLDVVTEDGQKLIRAVVTAGGKPVENANISFGIKRTFGTLLLGEDRTLDDGSAAVKFPADIPGGPTGTLDVTAQIIAPPQYASIRAQGSFGGAKKFNSNSKPLPRALWAPRAPYPLLIPIVVLVAGVWLAYAFVFIQVLAIRKGAKK
jgi:hypothetical protein